MTLLTGSYNGPMPFPRPEAHAQEGGTEDVFADPELDALQFIGRVLELAEDTASPLGDRCRFLVLVQANLEAFLTVRGGLLHSLRESGPPVTGGLPPSVQLALVRREVALLHQRLDRATRHTLALLAEQAVTVRRWTELDRTQQERALTQAAPWLGPSLEVLPVDEWQGFPFLIPGQLYVFARINSGGRNRVVRVPLPPNAPRLLTVGDGTYLPLEEAVAALVPAATNGRLADWTTCRVTRSAEVTTLDDDGDDVAASVSWTVHARTYGAVVRLELGFGEASQLQNLIRQGVVVHPHDVRTAAQPLDVRYLQELREATSLNPQPQAQRDPFALDSSVLTRLRTGDLLLHHPDDSFDTTVLRFLREAAADPDVEALHAVLYRLAPSSAIGEALLAAAHRGARVEVLLELRARFDEDHNASWAHRLRAAGATVHAGHAHYKTHAKLLLVQRREGGVLRRYAHLSTGNYHEGTARSYEDFGLLTARPELCGQLADVFADLAAGRTPPTSPALVTAPTGLREELTGRIDRAAASAASGHAARVALKVNALTDRSLAASLRAAAVAGVQVDLLVRSACILRPDEHGRIRVRSIVGTVLQHSRIFSFQTDDQDEVFLGSADLMPRNLDRRIEVLVRVEEEQQRVRLREEIARAWVLRTDAWDLEPTGQWTRLTLSRATRLPERRRLRP